MSTLNVLWSYAYARNAQLDERIVDWRPPHGMRFFADSGAHSARTLGLDISVDNYGEWLRKWEPRFTVYANLDVIYGPKSTYRNQKALESNGFHPMPVFHTGEPWDWLEKYLSEGYTYIALGKLLGNPWKVLRPWLHKAFRIADGQAVFHGFGLTAWKAIQEFPFYSVDSSSWSGAYRFGVLKLFDRGRWVTVRLRDRADVAEHATLLSQYGLPLSALTREGYNRKAVASASAEAFIRAGEWTARRHGRIELPKGKGYPPGPRLAPTLPASQAGSMTSYLAEGGKGQYLADHVAHRPESFTMYLAETTQYWHDRHALTVRKRSAAT